MKKSILLLMLCLFSSLGAMAQVKSITGVVSDANGEAIIGASVVEVGTTNGVITDIDGKFSLKVHDNAQISISYIGYTTQVLSVKGKMNFRVQLVEDSKVLEEVVVTGYGGKQLRSKLTSAISKVDETAIVSGVKSNPASALAGTVSGLVVQQNSGKPGATPSVVLRGGTSLDGTGSPLYVIDGVVRTISDFNPEDIESMEVLKDASATSIYGARANNGVILITTKRGKSGKAQISFKAKAGLSYMGYMPEFLHAGDYIHWQRTGIKNASEAGSDYVKSWLDLLTQANGFGTGNLIYDPNTGAVLDGNKDARAIYSTMILNDQNRYKLGQGWNTMIDPVYGDELIYTETDFRKEAFRKMALTQDYNVSVSGGNDKGHYYMGLGYYDEKGFPVNSWYKRLNFTLNADYKVNNWLTSYSSFNFADAKWKDPTNMNQSIAEYFGRMLSVPPTMRGVNEEGEMLMGVHSKDGNPNYNADKFVRRNNTDKFSFSQTFQFDITKNIYLKAVGNVYYSEGVYESMNRDFLERPNQINTVRSTSAQFERELTQTYNVIGGWNQSFKKHNFDVLVGGEFYDWQKIGFSAAGEGAPTDDFLDLGLTTSEKNKRSIDSWHDHQRIMSYFGKVNYDFDGKYLFSFTFRGDGSSKLIDNRWGFFPGISAGWNILKESFMENTTDVLSFLKLRAGYGQNGNINPNYIGSYTLQGSYGTTGKYNGTLGYTLGNLPLPGIYWEKSATFDAAVDVSFLSNKYNLSVGYFNRLTSDLYAYIDLPGSSGKSTLLTNNGKVRNQGLEIDASVNVLDLRDWKWKIGGNISLIKSVIEELPYNGNENNRQGGQEVYTGRKLPDGDYEKVWVGGKQEGQRVGSMYGFVAEGFYRNEEEIRQHGIKKDVTMARTIYSPDEYAKLTDAEKKNAHVLAPGDVKWKDINGDGVIDQYDQAYLGNQIPKWTGGFNTTVTWKDFSLYAKFDFALGHTIYDSLRPQFLSNNQGEFNTTVDVKDTWTPDNLNAKYPRYDRADGLVKNNYRTSTIFAYNGNYLCVRDVTLSYSVPRVLLEKVQIQGLTLSITGQNLAYLKSDIYTPEGRGFANSTYPLPISVVFGAQLTF